MRKIGYIAGIVAIAGLTLSNPTTSSHSAIEVYTVQPGDNLMTICERYRERDCDDPYILEYMDEIRAANPQLVANKNQLQPGDKLMMVWKVND